MVLGSLIPSVTTLFEHFRGKLKLIFWAVFYELQFLRAWKEVIALPAAPWGDLDISITPQYTLTRSRQVCDFFFFLEMLSHASESLHMLFILSRICPSCPSPTVSLPYVCLGNSSFTSQVSTQGSCSPWQASPDPPRLPPTLFFVSHCSLCRLHLGARPSLRLCQLLLIARLWATGNQGPYRFRLYPRA